MALALALGWLVPAQGQDGHWLTGYYAIYDQNGVMTPSQVDMTKLTHIIYWGVEPTDTGGLNTTKYVSASTFASGATNLVAAAHAAGAKALIGIGGDADNGYSLAFNQATTPANLTAFVTSIVNLMQQYGFDGVDINWEQIGYYSGDNTQFPAFIKALRTQLNTLTPRPLLTMSPETAGNGGRTDLIGPIYQDFDQINIQTYLMSGPYCGWETWYNSPLSNSGQTFVLEAGEPLPSITGAVADYTGAGVPIGKLGMGIQFGGLEWDGGAGTSTGGATKPEQIWTNDANAAYCSATNPSAPTLNYPLYTTIAPLASGAPANGYTVNTDSVADQSWLSYDPSGTGSTNEAKDKFIAYDDPASIEKKGTDLSGGTGLGGSMGGVMLFELSGDYFPAAATGEQHPLLDAANAMEFLLPGNVTGLTITAGIGSAALQWSAAPFATKYQVYSSTVSGNAGTLSGTVSAVQATVPNLTPGKLYYFQVWPVNAFGVASGGIATGSATIAGLTVSLSASSISYGPQSVGTDSASHPVTLTNTSAAALSIASIAVTGTNASSFVFANSCGASLAAGGSCTIHGHFAPTEAGMLTATVTITDDATGSPQSIALSGTGVAAPAVKLSATSLSYGTVNVDSTSSSKSVMVTNTGDETLSITSIALGGTGASSFVFANSCGASLAAGGSCTIHGHFAPTEAGMLTATVTITDDATGSPQRIALTGTGQ